MNDAFSSLTPARAGQSAAPCVAVALAGVDRGALVCVRCGDPRLRWLSRPDGAGSERGARDARETAPHPGATAWAICQRCGATSVWQGSSLIFPVLTMRELVQYQLRMALRALAGATFEDADRTAEVAALRARRDALRRFRLRALRYAPPPGPEARRDPSAWVTAEDALVMGVAAAEERQLDRLIAGARVIPRESMDRLKAALTTSWRQACVLDISPLPDELASAGGDRSPSPPMPRATA